MSEHIYELKTPFEYAHKGDTQEASFITLLAPTFKQLDKITPIKQAVTAAIAQISEAQAEHASKEGEPDSDDPTAAMMLAVLYQWDGNMTGVLLHAQELFKSGAALVDGEVKMTTPLMEKMSLEDFERMVGEYIARFLAPSLMAGE